MNALLIENGFVHTADDVGTILPSASILVVDDSIAAIGDVTSAVAALPPGTELTRIDARSMLVLPGFVNPHWHEMFALRVAFKGALRGHSDLGDELGFMAGGGDVLRISAVFDSMYGLAHALTPDEAEAIATYSMWTQLKCGTTALGDVGSVNRPEAMAQAARNVGIRASLGTWAADAVCPPDASRYRRTRDAEEVLAGVRKVISLCAADDSGLLQARPCGVYVTNMSDELGAGLAELSAAHGFAIHVGALRNEAAVMRQYYGTTPVRRLADLGLLSAGLMAVHTAFVDDEERKLLLDNDVHVSHSPAKYGATGESTLTETKLITELLSEGVDVSLSTDGVVFPLGGMPEAMRAAWQAHNEITADNRTLPPGAALRMATSVAARGLRWNDIGSLEAGRKADLVLVPRDDWRYLLNPRPLEAFLTLGGSSDVDTVIVAGRVVLRGGRSTRLDEDLVRERYLAALRSFSARSLGIGEDVLRGVFEEAK